MGENNNDSCETNDSTFDMLVEKYIQFRQHTKDYRYASPSAAILTLAYIHEKKSTYVRRAGGPY